MKRDGSAKRDLRQADRKMQDEAGVRLVVLHGCTRVHDNGDHCQHIYVPQDNRSACPKCGQLRYDASTNQPNEKVYWFPLQPRLQALLQLDSYRRLLQVRALLHVHHCMHLLLPHSTHLNGEFNAWYIHLDGPDT